MKTFDKVQKLRELISQYETESFCGHFAYFIRKRPHENANIALNKFDSKLKDFLYLIALKIFSNTTNNSVSFEIEEGIVNDIADLLNSIKSDYYVDDFNKYDIKSLLHEVAFRNHFDNGTLNYVEQDLEKLRSLYSDYNLLLQDEFGFDVDFVIEAYKASEQITRIRYEQLAGFMEREEFKMFVHSTSTKKISFTEGFNMLTEETQNSFLDFFGKEYKYLLFTAQDFYHIFPKEKVDKFLDTFSCKIEPNNEFIYYSDPNPLETAPIINLQNGSFLNIYQRQIPNAAIKLFSKFLMSDKNSYDRIKKIKEKKTEVKVFDIFRAFFNEKGTFFYNNYYLQKNFEQDLLIISKGAIIIVEVKASKLREPFRDIEKAVERIKSDFKQCIKYGYDQCKRVEDEVYSKEIVNIIDEKGKVQYSLNTKNIHSIYSIVVTLERFGALQTNLDLLLEKDNERKFPWSVYIDDLETFLLGLKATMRNPQAKFIEFLRHRQMFHGRVYAIDELDICGRYLGNRDEFIRISKQMDTFITFSPKDFQIFDYLYYSDRLKFKESVNLSFLNY